MFQVIEQVVGNAVVSSGISYEALCTILIGALFAIMIVGLVAGQELAFVLGGAGIIIGVIAWGGSGVNIAATKIYDQMQSYSMVAIPMFVLMANFLTHSKVADGLFLSIRYLLGPLKGGLGLAGGGGGPGVGHGAEEGVIVGIFQATGGRYNTGDGP